MLKEETTTRKVSDTKGNEYTVYAWYLLTNGWEYWQFEPVDGNGDAFGFVMGFAHEFGAFNIHEIAPHIFSTAKGDDLFDLAPPSYSDWTSWEWLENREGEE
jgi:hypothetical protein